MNVESTDWIRDPGVMRKWKESQQWWWVKNDAKGRLYNPKKVRFRGDDEFEAEVRFKYLGTEQFRHTFKVELPAGTYTLGVGPLSSPHRIREPLEVPVNPVNAWEEKAGVQFYFQVDKDDPERFYFEQRARNQSPLVDKSLVGIWEDTGKHTDERNHLLVAYRGDNKKDLGVQDFVEMRSRAYMDTGPFYYISPPGSSTLCSGFANIADLLAFAEKRAWRKVWEKT